MNPVRLPQLIFLSGCRGKNTVMTRLPSFFCFALLTSLSSAVFAQSGSNWSLTPVASGEGQRPEVITAQLLSADGSSLDVVCDSRNENKLSLRFRSPKNIGSSDNLVFVRFDTDPQFRPAKWDRQNNRTASIDDADYVDAFLRQIGPGEREIRIRALNFMNQPIDALFVSKSGSEPINKIKEYCGKPAI